MAVARNRRYPEPAKPAEPAELSEPARASAGRVIAPRASPLGQTRRGADQVVEPADQAQKKADQRAPRPAAVMPIDPDADQDEARDGAGQLEAKAVSAG